eukprot:jgi/Picsp_1/1556/NSC_05034-R1_---NA---
MQLSVLFMLGACLCVVVLGQAPSSAGDENTVSNGPAREIGQQEYNETCGTPYGPCSPGYGFQVNWFDGPDYCPAVQPCPEGYFCIHNGYTDRGDNICVPELKQCGNYLERCCLPHVCPGTGEEGEPLACKASGGPYFPPGGGICLPNPECGRLEQPCCQPYGNRDYWSDRATHGGSRGDLCEEGLYCQFDNCRRQTPISGTCVKNTPGCGTSVGTPCCIRTSVTYEAYGKSMQSFECKAGLACQETTLTCIELPKTQENKKNLLSIPELQQSCGRPGGLCFPAWNGSMRLTSDYFPADFSCPADREQCPSGYICALHPSKRYMNGTQEVYGDLPMCFGPIDATCGTLDRPCCPWPPRSDQERPSEFGGDLWCNETDGFGTQLQCISSSSPRTESYFHGEDIITGHRCVKRQPCGSLGQSCCGFYTMPYMNPPGSFNATGSDSLACSDGLYCNYTNFIICPDRYTAYLYHGTESTGVYEMFLQTEQGTCVANPMDCGSDIDKPCCVRSLRQSSIFERREEYYCDSSQGLACDPESRRVRFGHGLGRHPTCTHILNETLATE